MFSILTNMFKNSVRENILPCIISFLGQVRDHLFLIFSNGHRRSSRSQSNNTVLFTFGFGIVIESELMKLSIVRTISRDTPSTSSATRGV